MYIYLAMNFMSRGILTQRDLISILTGKRPSSSSSSSFGESSSSDAEEQVPEPLVQEQELE